MDRIKVLLAEGSSDDAALIGAHLRTDGRFSLGHASFLSHAIAELKSTPADVVILDLNLPDSQGINTFEDLHDRYPDVPIVILTDDDDENLAREALAKGAQDYVPKSDVDSRILSRSLMYAVERHARLRAERRRLLAERRNMAMESDLAVARRIQQHLLPKETPKIPGFDVGALCEPADACGGDFYNFIDRGDGQWDIIIADVSGHGFGSALIMAGVQRMLRTLAQHHEDIGQLLTETNRSLCMDTPEGHFVSMLYGRINAAARTFTYASAGHPCTIIRAQGDPVRLKYDGTVLGLLPEQVYQTDGCIRLHPGDQVLVMTDGASEAESPRSEFFGCDRIFDLVRASTSQQAADTVQMVFDSVEQFSQPNALTDDVTMVLLKSSSPQSDRRF